MGSQSRLDSESGALTAAYSDAIVQPFQELDAAGTKAEHWRSVEHILTSIEHESASLIDRLYAEVAADGRERSPRGLKPPRSPVASSIGVSAAPLGPARNAMVAGGAGGEVDVLDAEWDRAWTDLGASNEERYAHMQRRIDSLEAELAALRALASRGDRAVGSFVAAGARRAGRALVERVFNAWGLETARGGDRRRLARSMVARLVHRLAWRVFGAWAAVVRARTEAEARG